MKLIVENPNGIVESANYSRDSEGCSSLIINTRNKGVLPDAEMGCSDEQSFIFYASADDAKFANDKVLLQAETEEEKAIIRRLSFSLHSKDQLWYVFLDRSVYMKG